MEGDEVSIPGQVPTKDSESSLGKHSIPEGPGSWVSFALSLLGSINDSISSCTEITWRKIYGIYGSRYRLQRIGVSK